jgi:protocatechuate 3,4-dioxygenase beta subunit
MMRVNGLLSGRVWAVFPIVVSVWVLSSCKEPSVSLKITGRVIDKSGKPVAGALVEWGDVTGQRDPGDRTTTGPDGVYLLPVRQYGVGYRLGVSAEGFSPAWYDHYPPWDSPRISDAEAIPPKAKDFVLETAHFIEGVAVDVDGKPISGVLVKARTKASGFFSSFSSPGDPTIIPGKGSYETRTDDEGRFRLDGMPPEGVNLNVTAAHRHVNDDNYAVDTPCRIVMTGSGRPGWIRGRVTDGRTGQLVMDYNVVRRYFPEPRRITSSEGHFEWTDDLTEGGTPTFYIYAKGYAPWSGPIEPMAMAKKTTYTIALEAAKPLLGRTVDADTGKAAAGCEIIYGIVKDAGYFEWEDWSKYVDGYHSLDMVQRSTTDGKGLFWFCEDVDRPGGFILRAKGYARAIITPEKRPGAGPDGIIEIRMQPEASVSGVIHQDGRPLNDTLVHIYRKQARRKIEDNFEKTRTDRKGRFQFDRLEAGTYELSAERFVSRFYSDTEFLCSITVEAGEKKDAGRLEMPKPEVSPTRVR